MPALADAKGLTHVGCKIACSRLMLGLQAKLTGLVLLGVPCWACAVICACVAAQSTVCAFWGEMGRGLGELKAGHRAEK